MAEAGFIAPAAGGNYSYSDWIFTPYPHLFGWIPGTANITGVLLMIILTLMVVTSQVLDKNEFHDIRSHIGALTFFFIFRIGFVEEDFSTFSTIVISNIWGLLFY